MSDEVLLHYGTKRHSGRYPWGSGQSPFEHDTFLTKVSALKKQGLSEKEVASSMNMTTSQLRSGIALSNEAEKKRIYSALKDLKGQGYSNSELAELSGRNESSVRWMLDNADKAESKRISATSDVLKEALKEKPYLDVGAGVNIEMGISKNKLDKAVDQLEKEGLFVHTVYVKQVNNPDQWTTIKVLTKEPNIDVVRANRDKIDIPSKWTDDGGATYKGLEPIKSISSKNVKIKYAEEGGLDRDGLIQIRPGNPDLDLGNNHYAQVRIAVDGTHYLKGMAMYSNDLPKGVDVQFNTNKSVGTPMKKVIKPLKAPLDQPDIAFGATVQRQKGALNIVNEEGDWASWDGSKFPSQFLSKQPLSLVKERLKDTYDGVEREYKEIKSLTNPIVKKHLLEELASDAESKTRHLKAVGIARTKAHVLLPFPDMKPTEIYAPNYKDGERLALVRYPHGGTFEIPELTVNNKVRSAKKAIGNAVDAVGIHPSVARKLSGADFDGDTAYMIPNSNKKVKATSSLKGLEGFDPNVYEVNHTTISKRQKQTMMGEVSNLITDMTIKGASSSELARAVRHSMVVIDSEKHKLDWRKSAEDNAIGALRKKYQSRESVSFVQTGKKYNPKTGRVEKVGTYKKGSVRVGASTLISRSKSELETDSTKVEIPGANGKVRTVKRDIKKVPLMSLVTDANDISSHTAVENAYANYINKLKAVQNSATKEAYSIKPVVRDKQMAKVYMDQVKTLRTKLDIANANAPKERKAQLLANKYYADHVTADMDNEQKKKLKSIGLAKSRTESGAQRVPVDITDKEWEAIQNNAVSNTMLESILKYADSDKVKQLATPKESVSISPAKLARAHTLMDKGYTNAEIATSLGISTTTLYRALKGDG